MDQRVFSKWIKYQYINLFDSLAAQIDENWCQLVAGIQQNLDPGNCPWTIMIKMNFIWWVIHYCTSVSILINIKTLNTQICV